MSQENVDLVRSALSSLFNRRDVEAFVLAGHPGYRVGLGSCRVPRATTGEKVSDRWCVTLRRCGADDEGRARRGG